MHRHVPVISIFLFSRFCFICSCFENQTDRMDDKGNNVNLIDKSLPFSDTAKLNIRSDRSGIRTD